MKIAETLQKTWQAAKKQSWLALAGAVILAVIIVGTAYLRKHLKVPPPQVNPTTYTPNPAFSNPQKVGALVSIDGTGNQGTWAALTTLAATSPPFTGTVQPVGLAVSVDGTGNPGTWAAATPSTFSNVLVKLPMTSYSGTSGAPVLGAILTSSSSGLYRWCAYLMTTVVGTGGAFYINLTYTAEGHSFTDRLTGQVSATSISDSATLNDTTGGSAGCVTFWGDAGTGTNTYLMPQGTVTGTPTVMFSATLEQLE